MSKILKILEKWKHRKQPAPKHEVIAVLNRYFPENYKFKSGSHIVVWHPLLKGLQEYGAKGEFTIVIESGKRVKHIYLRRLLAVIEYLSEMGA